MKGVHDTTGNRVSCEILNILSKTDEDEVTKCGQLEKFLRRVAFFQKDRFADLKTSHLVQKWVVIFACRLTIE